MTILEIHQMFKMQLDKNAINIGLGGCPAFLPEEIDYWLNKAFIQLINRKFTGNNALHIPFEGAVKRISDLEKLVKTDSNLALTLNSGTNTLTLDNFSNNNTRMFFVSAVLNFGDKSSTVDVITHEESYRVRKTYNNYPWIDTPKCTINDNKITLYIDTVTMHEPYKLDLTYIKYPESINYEHFENTPEGIPEYMCYELVDLAAALALENIESSRAQSSLQLNQITE